jgi:hypothetical protein
MDNSSILGVSGIVISVAGVIFTAVNHKRIRSNCCGKTLEASLDVEATTPPIKSIPVVNGKSENPVVSTQ